ncbi:hypothetical protein SOVF_026910 [Spinacia oleracea]|nr:hypothetical protein SOVF_026910 [Spinacia oleracea]
MAMSFENALNSWLGSLGILEKRELDGMHLGVLASFRLVKLDVHFILAALEAWDPNNHVFRFGNNEVCPLPEEFSAILGWPIMPEPCMPSVEEHFFLGFERYLGLKPPLLSAVVYGRGVDLSLLVNYFAGLDVLKAFRLRALNFCIFARFLFSKQGLGNSDASLIEIVEQFASGRDPMPLVIGETLIGLDILKSDPSPWPSRSPVLFQVWLMERLMLVAPPENMESYNRKGFIVRPMRYGRLSLDEWRCALSGIESCIRWVVPWWGITAMRYAPGSTALRIPSLTMLVFYSPARVMRQYGLKQEVPDCTEENPKPVALNASRLEVWRRYWITKPFLSIQFPPEPVTLSAGYIIWMKGPNQRDISLSGPARVRGSRARRPASTDYEEGDRSVARPVLDRTESKRGSSSSRLGRLASSFSRRLGKGNIDD